ncbi:acyltransferase [Novosphingobium mangrovi (ex Huang et al. 2023)]|uniref:Acyltransferase n=1 Tax=Novosphingobium mangrovi (ex Huang et al. 2023) TaxID=2976432 RepID=A0ABT2I6Z0_9SPHN|nr:acyltransferase [Novosphingobium mangrovi (ex Huang et al. 2023)]MCT2400589.1 acyltransferase [Novosphingobium mangrovi (ex Huang et al. 2023)]
MATTQVASATTEKAKPKAQRNQTVEALRVLSAFGIVVFHGGGEWAPLAYTGLIVFVALSPMIDANYNWERIRPTAALARSLLLPWAFWMAVYGVFAIVRHKPVLPPDAPILGVLMGTSQHLWFLPFIFGVLVVQGSLKQRVPAQTVFVASSLLAFATIASAYLWRPLALTWPVPLPQWAHVAGAVFAGTAIGIAPRAGRLAYPCLILIGLGLAILILKPVSGMTLTYCLGLPLTAAAVFFGKRLWPDSLSIQPVADCMLGVYLVHIIILSLSGLILPRGSLLHAAVAFMTSLAIVYAARRLVPATRIVLG